MQYGQATWAIRPFSVRGRLGTHFIAHGKKEKQKKYRLYRTRYGYIQLPYQYAYKQYTGHCAQRKLTDTQFPQPESQEYSEENGKFGAFPELVENPFHNQVV